MDLIKEQQMEALKIGIEYAQKLVPAIREILPELRGYEKEDTSDYLNQIIDGVNFIIEIVNGTISYINEKEPVINQDGIEEKVQQLNDALQEKNNEKTAIALQEGILPFLEIFARIAEIMTEKERNL